MLVFRKLLLTGGLGHHRTDALKFCSNAVCRRNSVVADFGLGGVFDFGGDDILNRWEFGRFGRCNCRCYGCQINAVVLLLFNWRGRFNGGFNDNGGGLCRCGDLWTFGLGLRWYVRDLRFGLFNCLFRNRLLDGINRCCGRSNRNAGHSDVWGWDGGWSGGAQVDCPVTGAGFNLAVNLTLGNARQHFSVRLRWFGAKVSVIRCQIAEILSDRLHCVERIFEPLQRARESSIRNS